ncbi:MAG: acetylglutamate kinase [Pelolinea sp.]|nr:acetylglutamate kinase [Pelolinea sp.]
MKKPYLVIKIGGNELEVCDFITGLSADIKELQKENACILVHGGGRAIDELMEKMFIPPHFKNGQRVTDQKTLEVAEMVLSGKINKDLVVALNAVGLDAIGLSGVDRNLLQVVPWDGEMDLVGRITKVRAELLVEYCAQDVIPVISPISIGPAGKYNVNADHAAGMIAGALFAQQIVFISNVPGVLVDYHIAMQLRDTQVEELIENKAIHGGMIPKVQAALDALNYGAQSALITNLEGWMKRSGTTIITERKASNG